MSQCIAGVGVGARYERGRSDDERGSDEECIDLHGGLDCGSARREGAKVRDMYAIHVGGVCARRK